MQHLKCMSPRFEGRMQQGLRTVHPRTGCRFVLGAGDPVTLATMTAKSLPYWLCGTHLQVKHCMLYV